MSDSTLDIDGVLTGVNGEEFEVVSRSENSLNGEVQYTVISKADGDVRRKERAEADEAARLAAETQAAIDTPPPAPTEDAAPAVASEVPETLIPRS